MNCMIKKVEGGLKIILYCLMAILGIWFIVSFIMGRPKTIILLVIAIFSMITIINVQSNKKEYYTLVVINAAIQLDIILYGSFSDNIAMLFIMFSCNIYGLVRKKEIKKYVIVWLTYIVLCEITGIMEAVGIIHIESGVYSVLTQNVVVDIACIIIVCVTAVIRDESLQKYALPVNIIFLSVGSFFVIGGMMYLQVEKMQYRSEEINILQATEGRCIIESVLLNGQVVTKNGNSLVIEQNKNSSDQIFTFTRDDSGAYTFYLGTSDLMMRVEEDGTENESRVCLGTMNGERNEKWLVIEQEGGGYSIVSLYNILRIDYDLMDTTQGILLKMSVDNGNASQQFRLYAPNDKQLLSKYIGEINGMPLLKAFRSLILCVFGMLIIIVFDIILENRIRRQ